MATERSDNNKTVFLWGDIETGGLNGRLENGALGMEFYPIFEIAVIVTDIELNILGEPLRIVIHQSEESIAKSHDWALKTHSDNGLLDEVRASKTSLSDAEGQILAYLADLGVPKYDRKTKEGAIFAGNSIMFDRDFLMCQMETLHEYFHYRQLDVSAVALGMRYWNPEVASMVNKKYSHLAIDDIKESIEEARIYKTFFQTGRAG